MTSLANLQADKTLPISFPGLFGDWEFTLDPVAIHVGNGIYWYGIILAIAMLAGFYLALKQRKHFGLSEDDVMDMLLAGVPSCIIGARIYYVIFYLDLYRNADGSLNFMKMIRIWDGGLAIYGAVIAGAIAAFFVARHKKLKLGALTDLCVMGLMLGQSIGRWANFVNREAYGGLTDLPWRMRLWVNEALYIDVHPTFFYESMWNLVGLLLLLFVVTRGRRFDGENTWFYFLWYGLGRLWIEGLRTDSLYLFDLELFGEPVRVSQALSLVMVIVSAFMLFYNLKIKKRTADGLFVHQVAAAAAAAAETEAVEEAASVEDVIAEESVEEATQVAAEEAVAEEVADEAVKAETPADSEEEAEDGDQN